MPEGTESADPAALGTIVIEVLGSARTGPAADNRRLVDGLDFVRQCNDTEIVV